MAWEVIKVDEDYKKGSRQYEIEYLTKEMKDKRIQVFARTAQEAVDRTRKKEDVHEITKVLTHINRWT